MLKIITTKSIVITMLTLSLFVFKAHAQEPTTIELIDDAKVFAQYDDEKPFVANYFTAHSEQEIIDFYKEKYGEIVSQERKRERLTVKFTQPENNIRIIISQQDAKHQVDLLIN